MYAIKKSDTMGESGEGGSLAISRQGSSRRAKDCAEYSFPWLGRFEG